MEPPLSIPEQSGPGAAPGDGGRTASTGCILALLIAVLVLLVAVPASLWTAGIACG